MPHSVRPRYWNPRLCMCVFGVLVGLSDSLLAQMQQASCIVTTRGSTAEMLDVTTLIECGSVESNATVHFDVTSVTGPSPRDRELEIVFSVAPNQEGRYATVHRTKLWLNEGATSVQGSLPFVMHLNSDVSGQRMQFWNVNVLEDQRNIEASRAIQMNPGSPYVRVRLNPGELPPYMLLQRGTQATTNLAILENGAQLKALPIPQTTPVINENPVFDLARDAMRVTSVRHIDSLPEYWHYYLQFRFVVLTSECLEKLRSERPQAALALKQFVSAGGVLMLITTNGNGQATIDDWLLGKQPVDPAAVGWESSSEGSRLLTVRPKHGDDDQEINQGTSNELENVNAGILESLVRPYGRGRVFCMSKANGYRNSNFGSTLTTSVGMAASSAYDENWSLRNMIASVGKPPIWTFCAIILLFGLILGPGLLTLTGWIGRRSLLILLVPLISMGATIAIVSYEVLHEGFGTYARTSAVLTIDESTGDAFVWSRQNYFSGWPPREGLSIPREVFCRPVGGFSLGRGNMNRNYAEGQYTVVHEPERSVWTGVLPARAQKQFLVAHALKTPMPIQVKRVDDKTVTLRNLMNEMLPMVICRDGKDGYYFAENVAANAELQLSMQTFDDIAGSLSRLRSEYSPGYPPELRSAGWASNANQSSMEILDQCWLGALSEQSGLSTIKPYGFVTLIHKCDELFHPIKADTQESLILVTGRASW